MPTSVERKSRGRMRMIRSARRNGLCFTVVSGIVAPTGRNGPHHIFFAAVHPKIRVARLLPQKCADCWYAEA
jgi:hypothetical protein